MNKLYVIIAAIVAVLVVLVILFSTFGQDEVVDEPLELAEPEETALEGALDEDGVPLPPEPVEEVVEVETPAAPEATPPAQQPTQRAQQPRAAMPDAPMYYEGSIEGGNRFRLSAAPQRNRDVEGRFFFERDPVPMQLRGQVDSAGGFSLRVFDAADTLQGILFGNDLGAPTVTGNWSDPANQDTRSFSMDTIPPRDQRLEGDWQEVGGEALLTVMNVTPIGISFVLEEGGQRVEGWAARMAERSIYTGISGCRVTFQFAASYIAVDAATACGEEVGETFDGRYSRGGETPPLELPSLREKRVLKSEAQQQAFARLVGQYEGAFRRAFEVVVQEQNQDDFAADVYVGGVPGRAGMDEGIVMIGPNGALWAAVIDLDTVRYFTNVKGHTDELPETIENWRQPFANKEIAYMSAPAQATVSLEQAQPPAQPQPVEPPDPGEEDWRTVPEGEPRQPAQPPELTPVDPSPETPQPPDPNEIQPIDPPEDDWQVREEDLPPPDPGAQPSAEDEGWGVIQQRTNQVR